MITAKDLKELSSSVNILYAEDEQMLRDGMESSLKKFFKNTFVAKNGQEAIEIYKKEDIDIVLTDINMPIMDGVELITQINKIQDNPVIIVLSAHNESRLLQKLINIEVNNFLNKPVEKDSLIKILYKNCSIINDKRLLQNYAKQLEDENYAMVRKNKILEQKLHQLASQTNKAEKKSLTQEKSVDVKTDNYFKVLVQDDKDELNDLSVELDTYLMMMFQNENLHFQYVEKLSEIYKKYATILNSYPEFYDLAEYINNLATAILTLKTKFMQDINQT
ncbi:MAG: response regulator, partial [Campylobacterota bacterium]|nr:response regulator [Campylobacterota bacterium]